MDKPVGPLSAACVKNLTDRLYEKRKTAAMDIEKLMRDYQKEQKEAEIKHLLALMCEEFMQSANPNVRKGGLIALAASAIALGKDSQNYTDKLFKPACNTLSSDRDSRVRYYACESLYNIVKVIRSAVIPHFASLFEGLAFCAQDPEATIRKGSEMLDKLLKEVVLDSEAGTLQVEKFVCLVKDRMYSENIYLRQFLVSWVSTLHSSPQFCLLPHLHELLDGLFLILGDDKAEIHRMTQDLMSQLLRDLEQRGASDELTSIINIVCSHCSSSGGIGQEQVLQTALQWLVQLIPLCPSAVCSHTSSFLQALLPSLQQPLGSAAAELARNGNDLLLDCIAQKQRQLPAESVASLVQVLLTACCTPATLQVSLSWLRRLLADTPLLLADHLSDIFSAMVKVLSDLSADDSAEAMTQCLRVLCDLAQCQELAEAASCLLQLVPHSVQASLPNEHPCFIRLLHEVFKLFSFRSKLSDSGHLIVIRLSEWLTPQRVFTALALHTLHSFPAEQPAVSSRVADCADLQCAFHLIAALNLFLLTDSSLHAFRLGIHRQEGDEVQELYTTLYKAWCHNPAATLALCFLSRNYSHARKLVTKFAEIEITTPLLIELDKLIQLLESPIFLFVRLDLLNPVYSSDLTCSLFGLLMCMPQTEAFHQLHRRLSCLPPPHAAAQLQQQQQQQQHQTANCDANLEHFMQVQELHRQARLVTNYSRQPAASILRVQSGPELGAARSKSALH